MEASAWQSQSGKAEMQASIAISNFIVPSCLAVGDSLKFQ